jgi:hypothetical protein
MSGMMLMLIMLIILKRYNQWGRQQNKTTYNIRMLRTIETSRNKSIRKETGNKTISKNKS